MPLICAHLRNLRRLPGSVRKDVSPVVKTWSAEVYEQPAFATCSLQVMDGLSLMLRNKVADSFKLDNNRFVAEKVGIIRGFQSLACIGDYEPLLTDKRYAPQGEFNFESFLVHRLQKPRPQLVMNRYARPDDRVSLWISFSR